MAVLKYKDSNGNYQELVGVIVQNEVVQTTGTSTTAVMSQNAVTNALSNKADTSSVYTKAQVDAKIAFSYDSTTKGLVFPTDTSIVEYDSTNHAIVFHG